MFATVSLLFAFIAGIIVGSVGLAIVAVVAGILWFGKAMEH